MSRPQKQALVDPRNNLDAEQQNPESRYQKRDLDTEKEPPRYHKNDILIPKKMHPLFTPLRRSI